jgi:(S)-2-hydroxy-acid oxidase
VLKALALGARAVFIGRPVLWGLAYNGQAGVEKVLQILNDELKRAMILTGCLKISDISKEKVIHLKYSPKYL